MPPDRFLFFWFFWVFWGVGGGQVRGAQAAVRGGRGKFISTLFPKMLIVGLDKQKRSC